MISTHNITKHYGNFAALDKVSFEIKKGEIVGLLGPNGAGKTTMMKILTCYMPPTSGHAVINGVSTDGNILEIKRKIGYLPESAPLYAEMTIAEYLEYIASMHDIAKEKRSASINRVMGICSLGEKKHQNMGELSKGFRQRVGLAAALIHDPAVLILDEPTSGLDPNQIVEIRDLIREIKKEKTILLSTHILSEVEATCDRIIIINKGRTVASGTKHELREAFVPRSSIEIIVEGIGTGIPTLLKQIPGIVDVSLDKKRDEKIVGVTVVLEEGMDPRKEIIQVLSRHNFGLLSIEKREATLEEVFARLTIEGKK